MNTMYRVGPNEYKSADQIEIDKIKQETAALQERMQAEAQQQLGLIEIYQKVEFNGQVLSSNDANEAAILRLHQGEIDGSLLNASWFIGRLKADPGLAQTFAWIKQPSKTELKWQEKNRRDIFDKVMTELSLSASDANFSLFRGHQELLDNSFAAKDAIQRGVVGGFAPASADELNEREAVRIDENNRFLMYQADTETLKRLTREQFDANRQAHLQAQADYDLKQRTDRQQWLDPLPAEYKGQPVTRAFFLQCSKDVLKYFVNRYGSAQVDKVLRGAA